jgi:hypothetical protein
VLPELLQETAEDRVGTPEEKASSIECTKFNGLYIREGRNGLRRSLMFFEEA